MGLRSCWDQSGSPSAGTGGTLKAPPAGSPRGTTGTGRPCHGGATRQPHPSPAAADSTDCSACPIPNPTHPPPGTVHCLVSRTKADACVSLQMPQSYNSSDPPHPVPPAPGIPMGQQRQQGLGRNAPGKKWAARRLLPAPAPPACTHAPCPTAAPHISPHISPRCITQGHAEPRQRDQGVPSIGAGPAASSPAPEGSDPSQIQAGVTGAPCQVRMEEPARHPMPSLGNPGFPGLDQAQGTRKDGQEQGCPRKTLLESNKKPCPPKPALQRRPQTSPTPAPHASAATALPSCFCIFQGFGLQRVDLCRWVFSEGKYKMGTQLSSCDFPISRCTCTRHGKILRKFLLKIKK